MKAAVDPTRVPHALANIYLEEYDAERQQSRMRLMGETLKPQWRDSVVGLCTDDYVSGSVAALWKESDTVVYFGRRAAILTYNLKYIDRAHVRSEEHTPELQPLMRISYAVFCMTKKKTN